MVLAIKAGDVGQRGHRRLFGEVVIDRLVATRAGPVVHSQQRRLHALVILMARRTSGDFGSFC